MPGGEEDRFRVLTFEEYKQRFEEKRRRDGRLYTESNIRYAYPFHPRNVEKSRRRALGPETPKTAPPRKRRHQQEGSQSPEEGTSKRPRQTTPETGPSWRISEDEDDWLADVFADIEASAETGSGGDRTKRSTEGGDAAGQASSSSGRGGPLRYIGASRSGKASYSFEHTHLLNTWGNAYSISTLGTTYETKCMITSLAHIPVQLVSFWMSYAEYSKLPRGTRVISVECVVIPKGFKTSFDTGVSVTSSANNTQGIFGQVAVGLNRRINNSVQQKAPSPLPSTLRYRGTTLHLPPTRPPFHPTEHPPPPIPSHPLTTPDRRSWVLSYTDA